MIDRDLEHIIAECDVVILTDDRRKLPVTLAIGMPYFEREMACCKVFLDNYVKPTRVTGVDTLQALSNALKLLRTHVVSMVRDLGYKIYDSDVDFESASCEEDYLVSLEALFATKLEDL